MLHLKGLGYLHIREVRVRISQEYLSLELGLYRYPPDAMLVKFEIDRNGYALVIKCGGDLERIENRCHGDPQGVFSEVHARADTVEQ